MLDFLDFYLTGRHGEPGARRAAAVRQQLSDQLAAGASREQANRAYYRAFAGERTADLDDWGARWFADRSTGARASTGAKASTGAGAGASTEQPEERLGSFYIDETRDELLAHQAAGAVLILVSGSFPALLRPIAADIGAAHILCTSPDEQNGLLTGEITGAPMIGPGKRTAVRTLLRTYSHIDPADCYAYGDHVSDLPLLAEVGHPVVVGGDPELFRALPGAMVLAARPGG